MHAQLAFEADEARTTLAQIGEQSRLDLEMELKARRDEAEKEFLSGHQEAVAQSQKYLEEANRQLAETTPAAPPSSAVQADTIADQAPAEAKELRDKAQASAKETVKAAEARAKALVKDAAEAYGRARV